MLMLKKWAYDNLQWNIDIVSNNDGKKQYSSEVSFSDPLRDAGYFCKTKTWNMKWILWQSTSEIFEWNIYGLWMVRNLRECSHRNFEHASSKSLHLGVHNTPFGPKHVKTEYDLLGTFGLKHALLSRHVVVMWRLSRKLVGLASTTPVTTQTAFKWNCAICTMASKVKLQQVFDFTPGFWCEFFYRKVTLTRRDPFLWCRNGMATG